MCFLFMDLSGAMSRPKCKRGAATGTKLIAAAGRPKSFGGLELHHDGALL
jgi:hypothetical protein